MFDKKFALCYTNNMKKQKFNASYLYNILALIITIILIIFLVVKSIPLSAKDVFYNNIDSIVELRASTDGVGDSFGTAEFVSSDGKLITNAHVVTYKSMGEVYTFENISIRFAKATDYVAVTLVKYDTELDIAVLQLVDVNTKFKAMQIADSDKLDFGDKVYAIGNASNYGLSITLGQISAPKINVENDGVTRLVIQCDLTISAGNSGGSLLDSRGRLIGVTTFRTKDNAGNVVYGVAYCLPINTVMNYVNA